MFGREIGIGQTPCSYDFYLVDFNKAFDNVDYWLLFCDLMNKVSDKSTFGYALACLLV